MLSIITENPSCKMHEGFFKCLATSSSNFFCSASMMDSPIILMSLSLIPIVIGTILFFSAKPSDQMIFLNFLLVMMQFSLCSSVAGDCAFNR